MTADARQGPSASIVIPAHDEEAVIGRLLHAILDEADPSEFEVVVSCNGTTDATPRIAGAFPGVHVVETPTPSKVAALNAGDAAVTAFPRIYLDADIDLTLDSLRAIVDVLEQGAPAAAPLPVIDTSGCSLGCKAYYAVWSRLGYMRFHVLGSGVYGLSAEGRGRFGEFPDVIADDQYVYGLFTDRERVNPPGATFTIYPPRRLRYVHRRGIRIALGNMQLKQMRHPVTAPHPDWRGVVRERPRLAGAAAVYAAITALAQLRARRRLRHGLLTTWHRDDSSRDAVHA